MLERLIVISIFGAMSAQADILSTTQRFFGTGGQVPDYVDGGRETDSTLLGQLPYSPADSDLGIQEILHEKALREPVIFTFSTSILRTDDAPSRNFPGDQESSWVSASRMGLTWRPHLAQGWFADLGMTQDLYRYDRTNAIDYENLNFRAGVYKNIPDLDDTVFFARYEYERLTFNSLGDGVYDSQRIRAGLQKTLWAIPRHQFTGGLSGAYELSTSPSVLERNETALDFSYRYSIADNLHTVASGRLSRFAFDQGGRDDLTMGAGVELIWQINRNVIATASLFFDKNDSDTVGADEYEAWTGGLGLGLRSFF